MINLLYCANLGVFDGLMLSLTSAVMHTSSPLTVYIMTMDLRELHREYKPITSHHADILEQIIKRGNSKNRVVLIDATKIFYDRMKESKNLNTGYTPYTLLRLLACEAGLPSPVLYLDADTMFNDDISAIEQYDISEYELAGVVDYLGRKFISKEYINAGVLYLNLCKINETKLFERTLALCSEKKMVFPDQDAINELVSYKLLLPRKFNEQHKWKKNTIIQHFSKTIYFFPFFKVVNIKQWQIELVQKVLKLRIYDSVYEQFRKDRKELGEAVLEPLQTYQPLTPGQQFKYSIGDRLSEQ